MIFNRSLTGIDEDMEDCLFDGYEILTHQVKNQEFQVARGSIVLGRNFIITFEIFHDTLYQTAIADGKDTYYYR
jgi:magnesium transporter